MDDEYRMTPVDPTEPSPRGCLPLICYIIASYPINWIVLCLLKAKAFSPNDSDLEALLLIGSPFTLWLDLMVAFVVIVMPFLIKVAHIFI